jgi:hypothetical protein
LLRLAPQLTSIFIDLKRSACSHVLCHPNSRAITRCHERCTWPPVVVVLLRPHGLPPRIHLHRHPERSLVHGHPQRALAASREGARVDRTALRGRGIHMTVVPDPRCTVVGLHGLLQMEGGAIVAATDGSKRVPLSLTHHIWRSPGPVAHPNGQIQINQFN